MKNLDNQDISTRPFGSDERYISVGSVRLGDRLCLRDKLQVVLADAGRFILAQAFDNSVPRLRTKLCSTSPERMRGDRRRLFKILRNCELNLRRIAPPLRSTIGLVFFSGALLVLGFGVVVSTANAQQAPAWRLNSATSKDNVVGPPTLRIAMKEKSLVAANILELSDVAELSGPEEIIQSVRNLPLGPGPVNGKPQTWTQDEILHILELRGVETKSIRWAGADACQVVHHAGVEPERLSQFTQSHLTPQITIQAERIVVGIVSAYLQKKTGANSGWIIKPTIPDAHSKLLSQRYSIKGIAGGEEPWIGLQKMTLLVNEKGVDTAIDIEVDIRLPPMVLASVGPISRGRVLQESDLKAVRLTPSMKVDEEDCFTDFAGLVGKEIRRNFSSGQPIQRGDIGPPRLIQQKDLIRIQVVSGAVVAETNGRAMQAGGIDEVIEVEVAETKKHLAGRVVSAGVVEVIAR